MPTNPRKREVIWKTGTGPPSGCAICGYHRRGSGESQTAGGETGHVRIEGTFEICGDCAQTIKTVTPA